jgi:O-antigen/teichoic acid export membrane protein
MQKKQLLLNTFTSVLQVIVLTGVFFALYRFLLKSIGVELLGVWSLVLSTTGVARISELGFSTSAVKFVAKYRALERGDTVAEVIQTAALSIGALTGLVLLIAYPLADWIFGFVVPVERLNVALSILPYALVSLWISQVTSVFLSGLDGTQRIDLKNVLMIVSAVFYLVCSLALTPGYGLRGLAWANVMQAGLTMLGSWLLLKRDLELPLFPYRWSYTIFKEMLGYAASLQLISVLKMLCDPLTKALMTMFGSLSAVGYYQMASRMVQQFRTLIISANQVVVPVIADLQERNPESVQRLYWDSYRLLFYISVPFYAVIAVLVPVISRMWIGGYEETFVLYSVLLVIGWFVNTLSGPAYFANLGTGDLRWNTIGHVSTALLNIGLGFVLGSLYGTNGVVFGWVCALVLSSLVIIVPCHLQHGIRLRELVPRESVGLVLASLVAVVVTVVLYSQLEGAWSLVALTSALGLLFVLVVIIPAWFHPMRRFLVSWIAEAVLKA